MMPTNPILLKALTWKAERGQRGCEGGTVGCWLELSVNRKALSERPETLREWDGQLQSPAGRPLAIQTGVGGRERHSLDEMAKLVSGR